MTPPPMVFEDTMFEEVTIPIGVKSSGGVGGGGSPPHGVRRRDDSNRVQKGAVEYKKQQREGRRGWLPP